MGLIQVRDRNGDRKVCGLKSYLIVALNAERESRILVYKTCVAISPVLKLTIMKFM